MSKKDFIALANALRTRGTELQNRYAKSPLYLTVVLREHEETVQKLADFCAQANPRFNRTLWISFINGECGPSGGKVKTAKGGK